jgi:hypothetical protein
MDEVMTYHCGSSKINLNRNKNSMLSLIPSLGLPILGKAKLGQTNAMANFGMQVVRASIYIGAKPNESPIFLASQNFDKANIGSKPSKLKQHYQKECS